MQIADNIVKLSGVGEKIAEHYARLGITRIADLLLDLPYNILDRSYAPSLANAEEGRVATLLVQASEYSAAPTRYNRKKMFSVYCEGSSGDITINFFNVNVDFIRNKLLPINAEHYVSGKLEKFNGKWQITNPDFIITPSEMVNKNPLEPIYHLTYGLKNAAVSKLIKQVLHHLKNMQLDEWQNADYLAKQGWENFTDSLQRLHNPQSEGDISSDSIYRKRIAFDELLAYQMMLYISRRKREIESGNIMQGQIMANQLTASLPFSLTNAQQKVVSEISQDMASSKRMMRLLQGDVGAGKTVVSLLAALQAVESGYQVAIMAPTEILARQHYKSISKMLENADLGLQVHISQYIGADKKSARKIVEDGLANGEINIAIGTHALFQKSVEFSRLGLIIIDEQHRFGVQQRIELANKGDKPDMLMMSATPIPRTLTMTIYGDMDISVIDQKPAGRKDIQTVAMSLSRIDDVVDAIARNIKAGNKSYWVCPFIEENEENEAFEDIAGVEQRYKHLSKIFGANKVGLIHGRIKEAEREQIMLAFRDGEIDVLVATTVIEVGVDVPSATAIIIENCERFGLAQLHQLRGRVGRNDKNCNCILLYGKMLGKVGMKRLEIMRASNDGFLIAEEDMNLRGAGDIVGIKQSGMPDFKVATLPDDSHLLKDAGDYVKYLSGIEYDKNAMAKLLHIFGFIS